MSTDKQVDQLKLAAALEAECRHSHGRAYLMLILLIRILRQTPKMSEEDLQTLAKATFTGMRGEIVKHALDGWHETTRPQYPHLPPVAIIELQTFINEKAIEGGAAFVELTKKWDNEPDEPNTDHLDCSAKGKINGQ